ncbi:High-affinity branched-chain amino acid transport ATP-binding protein LivF [Methylacidimicrobium cyclopophantes]|uniref:High-affinity branched-chain amino acid transport ATP-binding protein LivF n=1 Tax=Methylacidimicrobium cyclopophantes TaxID=1041766 RepID=A0A5E6MHN0_9BACT|nr:ATP-binding cassette domain-containing protein [Methylacidimicrobium cyclopophantes]VVM05525.1 High-affinity branched-chain amino acid transport ATP-binding protein LivF [Methylacidimicrobium cyclopophantes]
MAITGDPAGAEGTPPPLLRAEGLRLSFPPLPPIRIPSFTVRPSGLVAILATAEDAPPILERAILETLAGERRPETGRVFFQERDLGQFPLGWARDHGLSLLSTEKNFHAASSVESNLLRSAGSSLPTWLFRFLPLEEHLPLEAGKLSEVEQRWLALACALARRPQLLLLERPLEGLPPILLQALLERIVRLNLEEGIAFCFTAGPSPLIQTAVSSAYRVTSGLLAAA